MTYADAFHVVSNDLGRSGGLTLMAIMRNEIYTLPRFLAHYRALGVERFVICDDRSEDGTRDFLMTQPDVMVVGCAYPFGVDVETSIGGVRRTTTSGRFMRGGLRQLYGLGTWSLLVDADEFLALPAGLRLAEIAARAEAEGVRAVTGPMIDVYPETVAGLGDGHPFDPDTGWFFDAVPHLQLRAEGEPLQIYQGARARLLAEFGVVEYRLKTRILNRFRRPKFQNVNVIHKVAFARWEDGDAYANAHTTSLPTSRRLQLPLVHYKFNGDLQRRVAMMGEVHRDRAGARHYGEMERLLQQMARKGGRLTCRLSRPASGAAAFVASGNAVYD